MCMERRNSARPRLADYGAFASALKYCWRHVNPNCSPEVVLANRATAVQRSKVALGEKGSRGAEFDALRTPRPRAARATAAFASSGRRCMGGWTLPAAYSLLITQIKCSACRKLPLYFF